MPPLDSLPRPAASVGRTVGLLILRLYVACALVLVVVKTVELIIK
jgi:hypothetical protein